MKKILRSSSRLTQRKISLQRSYKFCSFSNDKSPFYGEPRPLEDETFPSNNMSGIDKLLLAISSAATALKDPTRADAVAVLGEVSGTFSLQSMYDRMMADPTGQRILRDKPIVNNKSIYGDQNFDEFIAQCGKGSFGEAYGKFMKQHGFEPDGRSDVKYISDPELAYVMLRYRQSHDFWHALCNLPPTVLGEIALKWVELFQTGLPVAGLSASFGPLRLSYAERKILREQYLPWAIRVGKNAPFLMNVYYEELFCEDLLLLREDLRIEPAPTFEF